MHIALRTAAVAAVAMVALSGCKPHGTTASSAPPPPAPPPAPVAASAPPPPPSAAPPMPPDQPAPQVSVSLAPGATQAGDVAGGHDIAFLKRFSGATIVNYETFPFEDYHVFFPDPANPTGWNWQNFTVEGQVTRIIYRLPRGHTALEALRNYEDLLHQAGFLQTNEGRPTGNGGDRYFVSGAYFQQWETSKDGIWNPLGLVYGNQEVSYVTAKAISDGKPVTVVLIVTSYVKPTDVTYAAKPQHFEPDQPSVIVDVVVSKAVQIQMVTVKAADMADALATKGFVDLYGINFDTDKTDIKPESASTLSEVASLMKIDRSLKLEVSGHTDNAGAKDHNMQLSQGRAQAVVRALSTTYGIEASRLVAKGYGDTKPVAPNTSPDNMAKNRRVELRKM